MGATAWLPDKPPPFVFTIAKYFCSSSNNCSQRKEIEKLFLHLSTTGVFTKKVSRAFSFGPLPYLCSVPEVLSLPGDKQGQSSLCWPLAVFLGLLILGLFCCLYFSIFFFFRLHGVTVFILLLCHILQKNWRAKFISHSYLLWTPQSQSKLQEKPRNS